jgi:hypothetical protein
MVWVKRVNNTDSGDATHWGGDHLDRIDMYHDNTDISGSLINPTVIATPTTYRDQILKIRNAANTFSYTMKAGTLTGNVNVNLPNAGADITLIASGAANDWGTLVQTFRDDALKQMNPAATFGYIHSTSAIIADRVVTWPLLTANDTVTFNDFAATLKSKNINIDENTVKHSTTNAQGDIYKYDSVSGKAIRVPRGTNGQVWTSTATDTGWATPAGGGGSTSMYDELVINGFKSGFWEGVGTSTNLSGFGLLGSLTNIGGTPAAYIDTTNGFQGLSWPMTTVDAPVGFKTSGVMSLRRLDPDLTVCFQLDENADFSDSRCYIGFANDLTETLASSQYLDTDIGIMLHKSSSDTFFKITRNDGVGSQVSTSSILSSDSGVHIIRIFATNASSKWSYQLDGGTIVDLTTDIPTATDQLGIIINGSQNDTTARSFRVFWVKLRQKERV